MGMDDHLNTMYQKRQAIEAGNTVKIKNAGSLSARVRIETLLDEHSFVETGAFVKPRTTDYNMVSLDAPADGVVTGFGTIDGRLVHVYSQDVSVINGSIGEMHAKKIVALYDQAIKVGAPVIGFLDSAGMRLQEGNDAFEGYGQIFVKQSMASGVIPQITAILGHCGGSGAIIPSLSDFVFMKKENTAFYLNSPNTLEAIKETETLIGAPGFCEAQGGVVDVVCEDEDSLIEDIRDLMAMLPANSGEEAPFDDGGDDYNRELMDLNTLVEGAVDGREVVGQLLDEGSYFELTEKFGQDLATVVGKLGGVTVGVIASAGLTTDSRLSLEATRKAAAFIERMDAFSIPIITLVDTKGYVASVEGESEGQAAFAAKMIGAYTNATVPKVTVLMNNAIGGAYVAMNSKHIGSDYVFAWPNAKVGTMDPESAVRIMYAEEVSTMPAILQDKIEEYRQEEMSPYTSAAHGYIDDIIEPSATRKRLIAVVDMLFTKYVSSPDRKHRSI